MSSTGGRPAELATVIARAAEGGPVVAFAVVHGRRSELTVGPTESLPSSPKATCHETLAFDVPQVGFRIYTGLQDAPKRTQAGISQLAADRRPTGLLYEGTASLNPRFLYDSARIHELLLSVGEESWAPDYADALLLTRVLADLATAAAGEANAPILLMQSPVAPFREYPEGPDDTGELPKVSRGAAIRLAIAVDTSESRLALFEQAARVATEHGMQLHLGDQRVGRVRGQWKRVVRPAPGRYEARRRTSAIRKPYALPDDVLAVTFVGPARVGASAAVLKALADRQIGVLAIAAASLQELAFINLVIALPPGADPASWPEPGLVTAAPAAIDELAAHCSLRDAGTREPADLGRNSDFQACLTGPLPWSGDDGQTDHPLWLRWETRVGETDRSAAVLGAVIDHLGRAPTVRRVHLDYARSRVSNDRHLCSAKVSIGLTPAIAADDLPTALSRLCRETQATVEWNLGAGRTQRSIGLGVAWREPWLGRVRSTGVV